MGAKAISFFSICQHHCCGCCAGAGAGAGSAAGGSAAGAAGVSAAGAAGGSAAGVSAAGAAGGSAAGAGGGVASCVVVVVVGVVVGPPLKYIHPIKTTKAAAASANRVFALLFMTKPFEFAVPLAS